MKKASVILGIIGGVIAILIGLVAVGGGVMFRTVMPEIMETEEFAEAYNEQLEGYSGEVMDAESMFNMAGSVYTGFGIFIIVAGIFGIVGGALVKKNNIVAGVLMLVGAALSLFSVVGFLAFLLMLLGGIFAFIKEKAAPQPVNTTDVPTESF